MKNFDHPYFARSISEFWRRWHISLSTWFRDYLYIPLGGSRVPKMRWAFNILLTFLISGLWHGANWTYIIWGALHGFYFILFESTGRFWGYLSTLFGPGKLPRLKVTLSTLTTFSLTAFAWIFFRANSISDASYIAGHLHSGWRAFLRESWKILVNGFQQGGNLSVKTVLNTFFQLLEPITSEPRTVIVFSLLALFFLFIVEILQYRGNLIEKINLQPAYVRHLIYASLVAIILIFGTDYASKQQAFIYFQF